jgi:hypothetical protein
MPELAAQLVGRDAELGAFAHALAEVERGPAGALALVGEPGIGKTRLLAELSASATRRGFLVFERGASEFERGAPFSVFADALDEYVAGLEPHRLARLDDGVRAELARALPGFGVAPSTALQAERFRTHRAVRALLELLAPLKPLVLALHDVQWADSGSLELLGALLRRPADGRLLIAFAARRHQLPEPLAVAVTRARGARTLVQLEPRTLTPGEARALLGDAPDAGALYDESGGNPLDLEQLSRARPGEGVASGGLPAVPFAIAASLAEELAQLSDGARRVLEGAAVASDPFEPELAAAAAATSEEEALEALDELLEHDLVRHTDVPRRFRFRHRSCVARSTSRRPAGGGSARTSAPRRRSRRAAPRRSSARITSSAAAATGTGRPWRRCGRRARRRRCTRLRPLRAAGRPAHRRSPHERRALPEPQDSGDARPQPLPQAPRVPRRGCPDG